MTTLLEIVQNAILFKTDFPFKNCWKTLTEDTVLIH